MASSVGVLDDVQDRADGAAGDLETSEGGVACEERCQRVGVLGRGRGSEEVGKAEGCRRVDDGNGGDVADECAAGQTLVCG